MARQLIKAARAAGDTSVPSADNISHNIYRWERGAVAPAERYKLYPWQCRSACVFALLGRAGAVSLRESGLDRP